MIYAYANAQGYVQFFQTNGEEQTLPNLTAYILDELPPPSPNNYYSFSIKTLEWIDARTEQQKYDDEARQVILKRNKLLYESDWTQIPGNPLTQSVQQQWAVYRQELRDIPNQFGFPFSINWPISP